jgi:hypothetical protein
MKNRNPDRRFNIIAVAIIAALAILSASASEVCADDWTDTFTDNCDLTFGTSTNRYVIDGSQALGYNTDGRYLVTFGAACRLVDFPRINLGLVAASSIGTVGDSTAFEDDRTAIGLGAGLKIIGEIDLWGGQFTIPPVTFGVMPHKILGESWSNDNAYGATVFGQIDIFEFFGRAYATIESGNPAGLLGLPTE